MQCSSLPQASGRGNTAIPASISRHLAPQTSTQRLHPVHLLASTTGNHLALMDRPSLMDFLSLLHDDRALHPRMRSALEMDHAFLVKLLGKCGAWSKHWRCKLAFLAEYTVRHSDIRILESHGLAGLDRDRFGTERLHWSFLPNARSGKHFDRGTAGYRRCGRMTRFGK